MHPSSWLKRHPVLKEVLFWCIPALLAGLALRLILLWYSPYAYWGSDSESYYGFSYQLLEKGKISLQEKRRFFYPLFLLFPSVLPGGTLKALAWLQHGIGLFTVLGFGYAVRKLFTQWRLWIIPLTVVYAALPVNLWYEHELLGEALYFDFMVWTLAGWIAWRGAEEPKRALRLWWAFFLPFALLMLTKPSARFFWPGVVIALVAVKAWQCLNWRHAAALAALFGLTLMMGLPSQGAWLLYTSAFPLTRLDTPLHADYKAEVADLVAYTRKRIDRYASEDSDSGIKLFLKYPNRQNERPLWAKLGDEETAEKTRLYKDLAKEAIFSRPDLFLYIALQRVVDSANLDAFKERRFTADYFATRLEHSYPKLSRHKRLAQRLFGVPLKAPAPDLATVQAWTAPRPGTAWAEFLQDHSMALNRSLALVSYPGEPHKGEATFRASPTPLAWVIALGGALSLLLPAYRTRLGVWTVAVGGYLVGVFLVGSANPRFFAPAWPLLLLLTPIALDAALAALLRKKAPAAAPERSPAPEAVS